MHSKTLMERALDVLAPCHCSLCGLPSERSIDLCLHCEGELPWLTVSCRHCALPLAGGSDRLCGHCLSQPPAFDRCIAACAYAAPIDNWILRGKYSGDFASLRVLAYLLRRALSDQGAVTPPPDLLVPMPLHWWRRLRRGFNQAAELSRELRRHPAFSTIPIDSGLVRRSRATASQRGLGPAERERNLRNAFRVTRELQGQSVAIVDDVLTTGASANALAMALKARGAGSVEVWCCARTAEPSAHV